MIYPISRELMIYPISCELMIYPISGELMIHTISCELMTHPISCELMIITLYLCSNVKVLSHCIYVVMWRYYYTVFM